MTTTILPRDFIKTRAKIDISSGSLSLISSRGKERGETIITASLASVAAGLKIRPDSMHVCPKKFPS